MADIYENAYVTIAAVGAHNASQGLFNTTSTYRKGAPLPGFPWLHIRQVTHLPYGSEEGFRTTMDDGWALYKRGWTFQELSLSPRALHFGTNEVFWSCREKTICEGDPKCGVHLPAVVSVSLSVSDVSAQKLWYEIINGYSWRNLTFEKDKLPAVAAFASRIQHSNTKNRYVAGLWKNTLLCDLLWFHHGDVADIEPTYPIQPGIIPSWSWVSSKCPVRWRIFALDIWQHIPCTEVIRTTYETEGPPVLGHIIEASLKLQAPMIRLPYKTTYQGLGICWESQGEIEDPRLVLYCCHWDHLEPSPGQGPDDDELPQLLAVPLIAKKSGEELETFCYNALLLTENGPGIYRRAGVGVLGILEDASEAYSMIGPRLRTKQDSQRMVEANNQYIETMCRLDKQEFKLV